MAPGKKSEIWRFFTPSDREYAKCNVCQKTYSTIGRTTSALRTHLKSHSKEYEILIQTEAEAQTLKTKLDKPEETPLQSITKQLSIEETLMKKKQWDNKHPFSLLSLTCHGITANFNRLNVVLKCEEFEGRHTGDAITNKFESMLSEWNINKAQVHCMVRDEGSNMKRAMTLAGFNDIDCTAHKLQTNIKNGLNSQEFLVNMIQKCKKIATHFNHSTIAQCQLAKIQMRLNPDQIPLTVIRDCTTRWNSTFYMLERCLKLKDALCLYANDNNISNVSPEEWKAMEYCVTVLKPFEEATRNLSSSHALISSVIPIIYTLKKVWMTQSYQLGAIPLIIL